jgi:hypothetical protein
MALKSIEQEWEGFAAMVFRKCSPPPVQAVEMRKAFFAGAWSMFCAIQEIGEPHISEDAGVEFLEARRAECLEFKKRLMAEYAETN